jgi:hypothetical protein
MMSSKKLVTTRSPWELRFLLFFGGSLLDPQADGFFVTHIILVEIS